MPRESGSSASLIRSFWRRLDTNVHPDDASFLALRGRNFNLDFPPPAFVGDVDNAPLVILMTHGGYNEQTSSEFSTEADCREFRQWLYGEKSMPQRLSRFYRELSIFPLLQQGKAVIVNAVAYRSDQPVSQTIAASLPSARVHRQWLEQEILPLAEKGTWLVIAHHYGPWNISKIKGTANLWFSSNPRARFISKKMLRDADRG